MTRAKRSQNEVADEMAPGEPVTRIRIFPIEAAIWRNRSSEGDPFYTVTFARMYCDREGQWKRSTSFNTDDLLTLAKIADLAHTKIVEPALETDKPSEPDV